MINNRTANSFRYGALVFSIIWYCVKYAKGLIPADAGDGIMHYFYSAGSWSNADFFLNHWGKPFFILLSSPFAQFGFAGVVVFNILVYTLTVIAGFKILDYFKIDKVVHIVFPLLLVLARDYSRTILGGMTEPLFNLASVFAILLFIKERYVFFAIVISLMPFMRSEGQLAVLLGFFLLLFAKQWKKIPLLAAGFVAYSIVGYFLFKDFLWYFTRSPYKMENDIYGVGTWDHYLLSYRNYLDNAGLFTIILGTAVFVYLLVKKRYEDIQFKWWFFSGGLFVGVVAAHSYFWATGQNASLGLTRIATQGMPLFMLLNIYYIGKAPILKEKWAQYGMAAIALIFAIVLATSKKFPIKPTPLEDKVLRAAKQMKTYDTEGKRIFYYYPMIAFELGENPLLENTKTYFFRSKNFQEEMKTTFSDGDYFVWDSQFGPREMNLPQDSLLSYPEMFIPIKTYEDNNPYDSRIVVIYRIKK
jgi:hypothetical protein